MSAQRDHYDGLIVGELVDVTITGARVLPGADVGLVPMQVGNWRPTINVRASGVRWKRTMPVDGAPQIGDVWVDALDARYFVRKDGYAQPMLLGEGNTSPERWETVHAGPTGPIRLAWRRGGPVVAPAEPVVEDQTNEPTDNRAAIVAGLRELAALIESRPDLPVPDGVEAQCLVGAMRHVRDDETGFAELRRIAGVLGVEPALDDAPGKPHPHAARTFAGGVHYHAPYVTTAYKRGYEPVAAPGTVDPTRGGGEARPAVREAVGPAAPVGDHCPVPDECDYCRTADIDGSPSDLDGAS